MRFGLLVALSTLCFTYQKVDAQVIRPPTPGNQMNISLTASVNRDAVTGLYTYSYTLANDKGSLEAVQFFAIALSGDAAQGIVNAQSPKGWTFTKHPGEPTVSWSAIEVDSVPPDFVDDGSDVPSQFQVRPGETLSGFSYQSPNAPTNVKTYVQGYASVPQAVDAGDLDEAGYVVTDYLDDSLIGVTEAPTAKDNNDQPSGLGLFTFLQLTNDAVRRSPVTIGVHFNAQANVDVQSFRVNLNGQDITKSFSPTGIGSDLSASLSPPSVPLINGSNVLEGTVSGVPPSLARVDFNYIRFFVNTSRNLDLNGDGQINCADMAIVKASFGSKQGEPRFDPRADVNGDGVVNIEDLALVAQQLPAGTKCQ